jgi:hypothetical protein
VDVSLYLSIVSKKDKVCKLCECKFEDYNPEISIEKLNYFSNQVVGSTLQKLGYSEDEVDICFLDKDEYDKISKSTYLEYQVEKTGDTIQCRVIKGDE